MLRLLRLECSESTYSTSTYTFTASLSLVKMSLFYVYLQGEPGDPGAQGIPGPAGLPGDQVSNKQSTNDMSKHGNLFVLCC